MVHPSLLEKIFHPHPFAKLEEVNPTPFVKEGIELRYWKHIESLICEIFEFIWYQPSKILRNTSERDYLVIYDSIYLCLILIWLLSWRNWCKLCTQGNSKLKTLFFTFPILFLSSTWWYYLASFCPDPFRGNIEKIFPFLANWNIHFSLAQDTQDPILTSLMFKIALNWILRIFNF